MDEIEQPLSLRAAPKVNADIVGLMKIAGHRLPSGTGRAQHQEVKVPALQYLERSDFVPTRQLEPTMIEHYLAAIPAGADHVHRGR
jgi:hypothetical protein